jgi:hypothetical protein
VSFAASLRRRRVDLRKVSGGGRGVGWRRGGELGWGSLYSIDN